MGRGLTTPAHTWRCFIRYSKATLGSCLWVPFDELESTRELKREYTFKPRFDNLEAVPTYEVDYENKLFGFPRHAPIQVDEIVDDSEEGLPCKFRFLGDLREYQQPVIEEFRKRLGKGYRDLILEADTGSGKSVMLLYMMHLLGRSTLIVVPKTDLVDQWRKNILKFTDIPASRIGLAQQDVCDFEGKSVVIGMIHSVCKDRYPEEFKRHFGVILYDELNKLGAYHFSKVGGMFPARYRIGATATLSRSDGLEKAFLVHLGSEVIKPKVSEQPVPKVAVYTYKENSGRLPSYLQDTISRRGVLLSRLAKNNKRSAVIAKFAVQLLDSGRQTLVVSERIPHLEKIHEYMIQMGIPESEIGFYLGATKKKERIRVANECSCILATMSMLSLGTDIPTLRGLVFATPVSQIAQPVGRIRRINPELKDPFVVDFYDSDYDECTRWMRSRRKFYESIGCQIHYIDN